MLCTEDEAGALIRTTLDEAEEILEEEIFARAAEPLRGESPDYGHRTPEELGPPNQALLSRDVLDLRIPLSAAARQTVEASGPKA